MDSEQVRLENLSANGAAHGAHELVTFVNGGSFANGDPEAAETDGMLQFGSQVARGNGEALSPVHDAEPRRSPRRRVCPPKISSVLKELNRLVCWKIRLWMVIVLLVLSIIAVILSSMALCAATHKDEDEMFDRSSFKVLRYFNGSFQMPNMVFTEELFDFSSNESQTLAADLRDKLSDLYRSSAALGRYFSKAEISAFSNDSLTGEYELTFVLPEEEEEQKDVGRFVVSREMVYNVFRQFLFDQETPRFDPAFIDPLSLVMNPTRR